ncbi:MAG: MATE family efflux transporter [Oscillospiraceae bacterium]
MQGYGEMGLAAYLIIGYVMLIILTVFLGLAEGLQPVFSTFCGTGEVQRSRALLRFSLRVVLGVGVLCYVLILFFARGFIGIFTPGDAELQAFTYQKSLWYFSGFFLAGVNILMISFWQSNRQAGRALPVSLLRSVVLPPLLILVLPAVFGAGAIWLCHSLSEAATAAVVLVMSGPRRGPARLKKARTKAGAGQF